MLKRTLTGILLVVVLVPLLVLGDWYFALAASFIAYMANYELLNMFSKEEPVLKSIKFTLPVWSAITVAFSFFDKTMLMPCIVMGIILFLIAMVINKNISFNTSMKLILSYIYGGCLPGLVLYLRNINLWIIVLVLVTVMLTDVGGYIFGYLFGKHKLCPSISPKKTVEGAVLGTLFGMICGCALYFVVTKVFNETILVPLSNLNICLEVLSIIGITLVLSIVGQLGDLVASRIKRANDIKDFGNIFPGHGGVLDRFDSTLLAASVMYVICYLIGVI
ncbi:MAG: phosphatidate cytidylyltransferase [Bacilli bacterium]|nr:phosphatidate cytidylyltransferase [Bacilli bacterium]